MDPNGHIIAEPGDGFKDIFSSCNDLSYLELMNSEDPTRNTIQQGAFNGDEFSIWREGQTSHGEFDLTTERFRVIFSKGHAACSKCYLSNLPLRMTSRTFHWMAREFHLPDSFLKMTLQDCTVFVDTQEKPHDSVLTLIMQNSFTSTSCFSAAFSYEPQGRLTSAFIHGLSGSELDSLTAQIIANRDRLGLPMLLPYLLLTMRGDSAINKTLKCHQQIVETECQTGITTNWHPSTSCCSSHQAQDVRPQNHITLDFDRVTHDLTRLSSKVAYCEYICEVHLPMLDKVHEINRRTLKAASQEHKKRLEKAEGHLRMDTKLLSACLTSTLSRAKYVSKRAQAQVQNVYSLIAQKDNALSMRDNAALKTISEDQKLIALAATRDSAAMRIIAAITTVFLPATFTATLFSTTFFNFQVGNQGQVVSWWLWLYFVVTVILSSLIISCWHFSLRRRVHEIDVAFGVKDETPASGRDLVGTNKDGAKKNA